MQELSIRLKPINEESLHSYIHRISHINGIELMDFLRLSQKAKTKHSLQASDIRLLDFEPQSLIDPEIINCITGLDINEIYRMSFHFVLQRFCGNNNLERSRFMSNMFRDEYYYCPYCLNDNPFQRLMWEIKELTICQIHEVKFENKCNSCKQVILIKDINLFNICPHCGNKISKKFTQSQQEIDRDLLEKEKYTKDVLEILIKPCAIKMAQKDVAFRILYELNNCVPEFHRNTVKKALGLHEKSLPTLLQHARQSLSAERSLSLTYLLEVLYENNIHLCDFLELQVPNQFVSSILEKPLLKKSEVFCLAPWCNNFKKKNKLIKTGTSYNTRKNGEIFKYYLVCPECGCEYAFNSDSNLIERTYFIKGYILLNEYEQKDLSIRKLSRKINLSIDRINRCISYYNGLRKLDNKMA